MNQGYRVLIVDDDTLWRQSLARRLEVRFVVDSASALCDVAADTLVKCQVVVLGASSPDSLVEAARQLRGGCCRPAIVGCLDQPVDGAVEAALARGGIDSVISRRCSLEDVEEAIVDAAAMARDASTARSRPLPSALRKADRLATIGRVAASIGHELNNLATPLLLSLPIIRAAKEAGEPLEDEDLEMLEGLADHLRAHAGVLLRMSRPPEWVGPGDLREVVHEVVELMAISGRTKRACVEVGLPDEPVPVRDPAGMRQVLVNLLHNAADAVFDVDGHARIRIDVECSSGGTRLRVADNGGGVAPELRERVFEPFFTTKSPAFATGLGLSVVRGIVEGAGGQARLDEGPDGGVVVSVSLPPVDRATRTSRSNLAA